MWHPNKVPQSLEIFDGGDFASLIDWKLKLVGLQNPFGQVKGAYVVLRGPLIEVQETGEHPDDHTFMKSAALLSRGDPKLFLDIAFEPAQMLPVFFLPIFWRTWLPVSARCTDV